MDNDQNNQENPNMVSRAEFDNLAERLAALENAVTSPETGEAPSRVFDPRRVAYILDKYYPHDFPDANDIVVPR